MRYDDASDPPCRREANALLPGGPLSVDVVCAGDSITGWNNFGGVDDWPYPTYPEYLGRLCEPSGLTVANGGIAGEVSPNGIGQVRDYLDLFPNARYFVVGYGTNDLGMWPDVERTSPRIVENLGSWSRAIRRKREDPILFDVPNANGSLFVGRSPRNSDCKRDYHNSRLRSTARSTRSRWSMSAGNSGTSTLPTTFHPNSEGARIIAEEVFRVLVEVRCSEIPDR